MIVSRYDGVCREYGPDTVTSTERDDRLQLELETFYVFAKILLDRIADTFGFYFNIKWRQAGSTHSQFASRVSQGKVGVSLPPSLVHRIKDLKERVVDYRTGLIENPGEPRLIRSTVITYFSDTKAPLIAMLPLVLFPNANDVEEWQRETEDPNTLLIAIDAYIEGMLDCLHAHIGEFMARK